MKKFIIADTHFGHENIIKYESRPFLNYEECSPTPIILFLRRKNPGKSYLCGIPGFSALISAFHLQSGTNQVVITFFVCPAISRIDWSKKCWSERTASTGLF